MLTVAGLHVPIMPFVEEVGSTGAAVPLHIEAIALKVGVVEGLTVTVSIVPAAHWPAFGVNVYVAVTVLLTIAGLQLPIMPLVEVFGSMGAAVPLQIGAIALKAGVMSGLTVTVSVVLVAH